MLKGSRIGDMENTADTVQRISQIWLAFLEKVETGNRESSRYDHSEPLALVARKGDTHQDKFEMPEKIPHKLFYYRIQIFRYFPNKKRAPHGYPLFLFNRLF